MKNDIDCPVDLVSVNENRVRLVALLVLALGLAYLFTGLWGIIVFLIADFFLRSFKLNAYSPLGIAAGLLIKVFSIGTKPTDQAPKRFAARMGLTFTIVILAFAMLQLSVIAFVLTIALCAFALLESVFAICAGCYVYSYWYKVTGYRPR